MLDIRPLQPADIPAALQLSTQAGWNQLDADWQRLINLWPETCLAGWENNQLVATGTLATYGSAIGWIGMILVDESCRGRGLGGTMFDSIIALADDLGIECLALDATAMGRPVYLKRGFVDNVAIGRWVRPAGAPPRQAAYKGKVWQAFDDEQWARVLDIDQSITGMDRWDLLRTLAGEPGAQVLATLVDDEITGFALARSGRTAAAIGPVLAPELDFTAMCLVDFLIHRLGKTDVIIDALANNTPFTDQLAAAGFELRRQLTRMVRGDLGGVHLSGHALFAGAGFELG